MRDAGYHQANQITEEIKDVKTNIETLQETQRSVLTAIADNQMLMSQVANHIGSQFTSEYKEEDENTPPCPQANATTANNNEFTAIIKNLAQEVNALKTYMMSLQNFHQQSPFPVTTQPFNPGMPSVQQPFYPYNGGGGGRGRGRGRGRRGGRGNRNQRTDTSKYCWTHGACNHPSWFCKNPKENHRYEATFENKLGGSTYYCPKKE